MLELLLQDFREGGLRCIAPTSPVDLCANPPPGYLPCAAPWGTALVCRGEGWGFTPPLHCPVQGPRRPNRAPAAYAATTFATAAGHCQCADCRPDCLPCGRPRVGACAPRPRPPSGRARVAGSLTDGGRGATTTPDQAELVGAAWDLRLRPAQRGRASAQRCGPSLLTPRPGGLADKPAGLGTEGRRAPVRAHGRASLEAI